jgi:hypothetical protein
MCIFRYLFFFQSIISLFATKPFQISAVIPISKESGKKLEWMPDGFKNSLASALATAVVKASLQPFDTIKTVQQISKASSTTLSTCLSIIEKRGFLGLWTGMGIAVVGSAPSVAVYFGIYSSLKSYFLVTFPPQYRLASIALSALIGNTIASIFRVPYEVFFFSNYITF